MFIIFIGIFLTVVNCSNNADFAPYERYSETVNIAISAEFVTLSDIVPEIDMVAKKKQDNLVLTSVILFFEGENREIETIAFCYAKPHERLNQVASMSIFLNAKSMIVEKFDWEKGHGKRVNVITDEISDKYMSYTMLELLACFDKNDRYLDKIKDITPEITIRLDSDRMLAYLYDASSAHYSPLFGYDSMREAKNETKNSFDRTYNSLILEWKADLNRYINNEYVKNDTFDFWFYNGYTNSIRTYYALYDIDGNGIMELLLRKQNDYGEDIIAYIFTMKDGDPINLFGYDYMDIPIEVPWSRVGSSQILDTGLIDCYNGDGAIYKIAEDGYSIIKFASSEPYDYPNEASRGEGKWRFSINEKEVDYDFYVQCLREQGYSENGDNILANIDWITIDPASK